MAKPTGFLEYKRTDPGKKSVARRVQDFREFEIPLNQTELQQQAARCMDCGVPSCHTFGCPLHNRIPDWNDMVYRGKWQRAYLLLQATNNFPEITGRICPAPCEAACTLSINDSPVTIRHIELQIVEKAWQEGWIQPIIAAQKSGKRVAVIGSGPAGLTAAQELARYGHAVTIFEKSDRIGGLLRYGIPDYKLEKWVIDRRLEQLQAEGVRFETGVAAGVDISARYLKKIFDAILLTTGSGVPRDIPIPGRGLDGIYFAMDFLTQQNRRIAGETIAGQREISAKNKQVVVIGGGDTGADCVGTARRQGASRIIQLEVLPKPPTERLPDNPWPTWPNILRNFSSHEEGCERLWSVRTKAFVGDLVDGVHVKRLQCVKLDWSVESGNPQPRCREIPGSEFSLDADLVLLAAGFLHTELGVLAEHLLLKTDKQGNISTGANAMTSNLGVFAAGDCVRGASLVVNAIAEGRRLAEQVQCYLAC